MTGANDREPGGRNDVTIVELFDAPRELVFRNWINAADLSTWFAPDDCTVTSCAIDARPGGKWRFEYRHESGAAYVEYGEFLEIVAPERLVFSLTQEDVAGSIGPKTLVTVSFAAKGAKTEMTFRQTGFKTAAERDNFTTGWKECFRKLETNMAEEES